MAIVLDGKSLTPQRVHDIAHGDVLVEIAPSSREAMRQGRAVVEHYLKAGIPAYGLNTGLGARVTKILPAEALESFSYRMVRGRAQGVGAPLPEPAVRAIMSVRLNTMLTGAAGQSEGVADCLAKALNGRLAPVMPRSASIGAADLVAMAAIPHALIGEGEMFFEGRRMQAAEALRVAQISVLKLEPKDGQVLCNNTAFTTGQAALTFVRAERAVASHVAAGALALEGFRGNISPFRTDAAELRLHPGASKAAAKIMRLVSGGLLVEEGKARRLQDPLSFRCMAQVFGAALSALDTLAQILAVELNSPSDNPAVLVEAKRVETTGNFHQIELALAADHLARALGWCATDGVSRIARLMSAGFSGLPPLLSSEAVERAGFGPLMKPIEALRGEVVQRANPVAIMPSHNADGQEDSLSHAPLAVEKLAALCEAYELLVAFELLAAAQAVDLARPERLARKLQELYGAIRAISPFIDEDRPVGREVERLADELVRSGRLVQL
ncbi:MAG TPA: aromatic amino acid lyase [Aestuariivirgaceae bacterium]|jgi:histidine ammonia-lyase